MRVLLCVSALRISDAASSSDGLTSTVALFDSCKCCQPLLLEAAQRIRVLRFRLSNWKHKRAVKKRYDLTARIYDVRYKEEQEAKYQAALADAKPKGLVLDVGCGTGLFFNHVSSKAKNVIGIDISKNLLHLAAERAKILDNVNLVQADADHLPFKNDVFNAIFAFTLLQNLPKPSETLTELHRTARRGAAVTVTGLKKAFSLEALKELLCRAGLRFVSVKDEEKLKCYVVLSLK